MPPRSYRAQDFGQHSKEEEGIELVELVPNAAAFNIREFCLAHRISESMYYKLRNAGLGPREARALSKVIITQEAAADWRRQREAQPAAVEN